jgi:hypothetical protein
MNFILKFLFLLHFNASAVHYKTNHICYLGSQCPPHVSTDKIELVPNQTTYVIQGFEVDSSTTDLKPFALRSSYQSEKEFNISIIATIVQKTGLTHETFRQDCSLPSCTTPADLTIIPMLQATVVQEIQGQVDPDIEGAFPIAETLKNQLREALKTKGKIIIFEIKVTSENPVSLSLSALTAFTQTDFENMNETFGDYGAKSIPIEENTLRHSQSLVAYIKANIGSDLTENIAESAPVATTSSTPVSSLNTGSLPSRSSLSSIKTVLLFAGGALTGMTALFVIQKISSFNLSKSFIADYIQVIFGNPVTRLYIKAYSQKLDMTGRFCRIVLNILEASDPSYLANDSEITEMGCKALLIQKGTLDSFSPDLQSLCALPEPTPSPLPEEAHTKWRIFR